MSTGTLQKWSSRCPFPKLFHVLLDLDIFNPGWSTKPDMCLNVFAARLQYTA